MIFIKIDICLNKFLVNFLNFTNFKWCNAFGFFFVNCELFSIVVSLKVTCGFLDTETIREIVWIELFNLKKNIFHIIDQIKGQLKLRVLSL